jgi:hypothetical protein
MAWYGQFLLDKARLFSLASRVVTSSCGVLLGVTNIMLRMIDNSEDPELKAGGTIIMNSVLVLGCLEIYVLLQTHTMQMNCWLVDTLPAYLDYRVV